MKNPAIVKNLNLYSNLLLIVLFSTVREKYVYYCKNNQEKCLLFVKNTSICI